MHFAAMYEIKFMQLHLNGESPNARHLNKESSNARVIFLTMYMYIRDKGCIKMYGGEGMPSAMLTTC